MRQSATTAVLLVIFIISAASTASFPPLPIERDHMGTGPAKTHIPADVSMDRDFAAAPRIQIASPAGDVLPRIAIVVVEGRRLVARVLIAEQPIAIIDQQHALRI